MENTNLHEFTINITGDELQLKARGETIVYRRNIRLAGLFTDSYCEFLSSCCGTKSWAVSVMTAENDDVICSKCRKKVPWALPRAYFDRYWPNVMEKNLAILGFNTLEIIVYQEEFTRLCKAFF